MKKMIKNEKNAVKFLQTALKISKSILKSPDSELKNANFTIENNKIIFKIDISGLENDETMNFESKIEQEGGKKGELLASKGAILLTNEIEEKKNSNKNLKSVQNIPNFENFAKKVEHIEKSSKIINESQNIISDSSNSTNLEENASYDKKTSKDNRKIGKNEPISDKNEQILSENEQKKSKIEKLSEKNQIKEKNVSIQINPEHAVEFSNKDNTFSQVLTEKNGEISEKNVGKAAIKSQFVEHNFLEENNNLPQNQDVAFDELLLEEGRWRSQKGGKVKIIEGDIQNIGEGRNDDFVAINTEYNADNLAISELQDHEQTLKKSGLQDVDFLNENEEKEEEDR